MIRIYERGFTEWVGSARGNSVRFDMGITRKQIGGFIFTTAIITTSAVIGHGITASLAGATVASVTAAEVVASVAGATWGAEVGSEMSEKLRKLFRGVLRYSVQQGLGDSKFGNDLSEALQRAFKTTIDELEKEWWSTTWGNNIILDAKGIYGKRSRAEAKQTQQAIKEFFNALKHDAGKFFPADEYIYFFFSDERTRQLMQRKDGISEDDFLKLFDVYFDKIPKRGSDQEKLVSFITVRLTDKLTSRFIEELKTNVRAGETFKLVLMEDAQAARSRIETAISQLHIQLETGFAQVERSIEQSEHDIKAHIDQAMILSRQKLVEQLSDRWPRRQELSKINEPTAETTLHNALLKLDYREQIRLFTKLNQQPQRANAFLIHGPRMFGQSWLLNRLVRIVTQDEAKVFPFDLRRKSRQVDIQALWREMYEKMELHDHCSIPIVRKTICHLWERQTVVLIFHGIDLMSKAYLKEFLITFWAQLRESQPRSGSFKLFMFLVDYSDGVKRWKIPFEEAHQVIGKPHFLVKLPVIESFNDSILTNWASHYDFLLDLTDEDTALEVIKQSQNGTPEEVMKYICCKIKHYHWEEVEKCLKH